MPEARSYMAEVLRALADELESTEKQVSSITMDGNGFTVALASSTVSVQATPGPLQPPFAI